MMSKILIIFTFILLLSQINGQNLERQSVSQSQQFQQSQQVQVPIRRINIPIDLKKSLHSMDQRKDIKTKTDNNCPQCLEKRLVQHYMLRGCTPVIKGGCDCPSRYECPTSARLVNNTANLYRNEKSLDTSSCRNVDCSINLDQKFEMGCTPVYSSDICCPIRYICPKRNLLRIRGVQSGSLMCEFEGRKYPIRSSLYTDDRCADCVCRVPPQFTCIQRNNCL